MKQSSRISMLLLMLVLSLMEPAIGQTFTASIQNQNVVGTDFYYDIYLLRTGGTEIYLGNSDLVVTFNASNFTSPTMSVTKAGATSSKIETWYAINSSIVSSNRAVLNVTQPPLSNQTEFDNRVEILSNSGNGTFIATMKITGINNPSGTAGLTWRLASPNNTVVHTLGTSDPWTSSDVTGGGTFTNPGDAPLPVQLKSFFAETHRLDVRLLWSTATEVGNYGFEIERREVQLAESIQADSWQKVGFVEGYGSSSVPREYSYVDSELAAGRYAYRLKQLDMNGAFSYSASVEVEVGIVPKQFVLEQNYPNPFNPSTTIEFVLPADGIASLKVYNVTGQEVVTLFDGPGSGGRLYQVIFDGSKVASGVYYYRLIFDNNLLTRKMILVK